MVELFIRWQYPSVEWVKLKIDGAAKGNLCATGGGGIIRGHRGEVYEVFAINCGSCTCTKAELMAVMKGLLVAWDGGHEKVTVEVDSEVAVRLLEGEAPL